MTPEALHTELGRLGLGIRQLGRMLAIDDRTVRRFANGDQPIPRSVELLLQRLSPEEARRLLRQAREDAQ